MFSANQRQRIYDLENTGLSYVEIANQMIKEFPKDWRAKTAARTVARILKDRKLVFDQPQETKKTLDEMTRDERSRHILNQLRSTPRFLMAFKNFEEDEKAVFVDEYMNVIRSTETLTEVEEQALFASILELILAFQALNRKEAEEKWRDQSLRGELSETDPKYRRHVDNKYQQEYDQHMKLYQKSMEQLKMSRKDRLKEVRSQKQSLLDLAESLSFKNTQTEAAEEISRLTKLRDDELKKLLDNGYLYGVFE